MRWLLPFFLLLGGWWLEWGPAPGRDRAGASRSLGLAITYVGIIGAAQVVATSIGVSPATGGRIGRALAHLLTDLVTPAGAFVLLVGVAVLGVIVGFGIPLRAAAPPGGRVGALVRATAAASLRRAPPTRTQRRAAAAAAAAAATNGRRRGPTARRRRRPAPSPGQTGAWGEDEELAIPARRPEQGPDLEHVRPAPGATGAAVGHAGRTGPPRARPATT